MICISLGIIMLYCYHNCNNIVIIIQLLYFSVETFRKDDTIGYQQPVFSLGNGEIRILIHQLLIDFSLTVMAATLIFIYGRGSAISREIRFYL